MTFPHNFVWGAAAASYQIEGAYQADERGLSVWDVFSHTPGKVWHGHTGDVACDHYHRYAEDVAAMQQLNLKAYRLSVAWSRILPEGTGRMSEKGLDFYDRLIDELMAAQITPYITLFHWDYPHELYCRGGWLNRDSADWFADYAGIVVSALSDRVQHWFTLNEPAVFVCMGHQTGEHAPGDQQPRGNVLRIAHNVLRAHGKAVQAIRANTRQPAQVGVAPNMEVPVPRTESPADIAAAQRQFAAITERDNFWYPTMWIDPMILGHYPADGMALWEADFPKIHDGDLDEICQPLDFLGINIYNGYHVSDSEHGPIAEKHAVGHAQTMFEWPVRPEVLYWGPKYLYERYQMPILITENGLASMDWVSLDGRVYDYQRIDYLQRHLLNAMRATQEGIDLRGYFQWSIMDNFEWAEGYKYRFGLIYVDYTTQQRTIKESGYWYRDVIKSHGASLLPSAS